MSGSLPTGDGEYRDRTDSAGDFDETGEIPSVQGVSSADRQAPDPLRVHPDPDDLDDLSTYREAPREHGANNDRTPREPASKYPDSRRHSSVAKRDMTVRGLARAVARTAESYPLTFRVESYDTYGDRHRPVPVQVGGVTTGDLRDGDEVEVVGRWKHGSLRASSVLNLTTGAQIKSPFRLRKLFLVGVVCVALLGAVVGILLAANLVNFGGNSSETDQRDGSRPGTSVTVPPVVGKDIAIAQERLSNAGLRVVVTTERSATVPFGHVTATEPPSGTRLPRDSVVEVRVSVKPQS